MKTQVYVVVRVFTSALREETSAAEPQDHLSVLRDQTGHHALIHQPYNTYNTIITINHQLIRK